MSLDIEFYTEVDLGGEEPKLIYLHHQNITHNLGKMAEAAGIYGILWRQEENNIKTAGDMIDILSKGLEDMKANPEKYKEYNPSNGWGSYDRFIPWLDDLLSACKQYPKAIVTTSR